MSHTFNVGPWAGISMGCANAWCCNLYRLARAIVGGHSNDQYRGLPGSPPPDPVTFRHRRGDDGLGCVRRATVLLGPGSAMRSRASPAGMTPVTAAAPHAFFAPPPLTRHVEDMPMAWTLSPLRAGTGRGSPTASCRMPPFPTPSATVCPRSGWRRSRG